MSKAAGQPSPNALIKVVDLLVESRIRIDAMEHVLKEINPMAHELYLGTIENLRAQKAAEVHQVLTQMLESEPAESQVDEKRRSVLGNQGRRLRDLDR